MPFFDFSSILDRIKCLGPYVYKHIGYIKNLERKFKTLEEKTNNLKRKRKQIEHEIEIGLRTNKRVKNECRNWLQDVEEIEKEIEEVSQSYEEVNNKCPERWYFNIRSNYNLSQMILSINKDRVELITKGLNGFLADEPPPAVEKLSIMPINKGTSTDHTLNNLLEYIQDVNIYKVGIWGMSGIGKTMLMQNLHNLPTIKNIFDIVIWITIGKDFNIENIQNEIARCLAITFSGNDLPNEIRARILSIILSCKRFMFLMDDVCENIVFDEIGIPYCNKGNGSKVVLTTRDHEVCRMMEIDHEIKMSPLSKDESWTLFHEIVGDVVDFRHIQPLARLIVENCGGLPSALIGVGGSLREEKSKKIWEYSFHEFSFPENLKNCFRYMALYPEDFEIDIFELIEYWRVEGFLDSTCELVKSRKQGHEYLRKLVNSSLLIECGNNKVKMHDLLRDIALEITSRPNSSDKFLVGQVSLKETLESNQWISVTKISLMDNYIKKLSRQTINCPSLKTLLLNHNHMLKKISPKFFDNMQCLGVLDLSFTCIKSLPPSIGNLVSLVGLYLRRCNRLKTLPREVGTLQRLEVLDLWHTWLYAIPKEVGLLTCLRVLQFTLSPKRDEDTDGAMSSCIIPRLQKLEQLSMCFFKEESKWDKLYAELAKGVCSLSRLTGLEFPFREMEHVQNFVQTSPSWKAGAIKMLRCYVGRGVQQTYTQIEEGLSLVEVVNENIGSIPRELLPLISSLQARSDRSIASLSELGLQNLRNLTFCWLGDFSAMEMVMRGLEIDINNAHGADGEEVPVLPSLEELMLGSMINLRGIWDGWFPKGSFSCLKLLSVGRCKNLKHVLSCEICEHLRNLEHLSISKCRALEEVISVDQFYESTKLPVLPKLKSLFLADLPELIVILSGDFHSSWPSLEEIDVRWDCRKLRKLHWGLNNAPKLKNIECERSWWDELIWSNETIKLELESRVNISKFEVG